MQAQHFNIGRKKQVILVVDQAGWHTSDKVEVPEGIHLEFLPSHSPELQPAERLWTLTNEPIANRNFDRNSTQTLLKSSIYQYLVETFRRNVSTIVLIPLT